MRHNFRTLVALTILLLNAAPARADRLIFLIAGQSNAAGMGALPAPPPQHPDRIFVYRNSGTWTPGYEPVDEPDGQVDIVSRDLRFGAGFGIAFADQLLELRPDISEVGLVPCARGGSTIARWAPHWSRESLYGSCLARALEAAQSGRIAGILWWQGEDESLATAQTWGREFAAVVRALRVDLGDLDLPVIFARLHAAPGADPKRSAVARVREQQTHLRARNATMISTDEVPYPDGWHTTTDGYSQVGHRFADALVTLLPLR